LVHSQSGCLSLPLEDLITIPALLLEPSVKGLYSLPLCIDSRTRMRIRDRVS